MASSSIQSRTLHVGDRSYTLEKLTKAPVPPQIKKLWQEAIQIWLLIRPEWTLHPEATHPTIPGIQFDFILTRSYLGVCGPTTYIYPIDLVGLHSGRHAELLADKLQFELGLGALCGIFFQPTSKSHFGCQLKLKTGPPPPRASSTSPEPVFRLKPELAWFRADLPLEEVVRLEEKGEARIPVSESLLEVCQRYLTLKQCWRSPASGSFQIFYKPFGVELGGEKKEDVELLEEIWENLKRLGDYGREEIILVPLFGK